jgi:hypothetical protein
VPAVVLYEESLNESLGSGRLRRTGTTIVYHLHHYGATGHRDGLTALDKLSKVAARSVRSCGIRSSQRRTDNVCH